MSTSPPTQRSTLSLHDALPICAFGTFLMRQAFLGLPSEIEEAARLDGASPWQMFWRVMLPLTKPSLSALTIITVLRSEEHTSELQSRGHVVCRLLLANKTTTSR